VHSFIYGERFVPEFNTIFNIYHACNCRLYGVVQEIAEEIFSAAGMKKIVFTGPESTGKTTLAEMFAKYYKCDYAREMSRSYLENIKRKYEYEDLLKIAKLQIEEEVRVMKTQPVFLFCDTDLLTIKIWSSYKFGTCDNWILEQINIRHYDLYFLCNIDVPWQFDPQRENPNERGEFLNIYRKELDKHNKKHVILSGDAEERFKHALKTITCL
jgi:nicotinamide riboside kinase